VEEFIMQKYQKKGLTREQIFSFSLKDIWPEIKNYKIMRKKTFYFNKK
jgi:hypothetical protein